MGIECFRVIPLSDIWVLLSIKVHIVNSISSMSLINHRAWVTWIGCCAVVQIPNCLLETSLVVINSLEWNRIARQKLTVRVGCGVQPVGILSTIEASRLYSFQLSH